MIKKVIIQLTGVAFMILGCYYLGIEKESTSPITNTGIPSRKSITFIMGDDKTSVPYFALAEDHFLSHSESQTDLIVKTCRTLEDVIQYLNNSESRGSSPWSIINIVAHGNPQTGLNLYLKDGGHKATPKRMLQSVLLSTNTRLKEGRVDSISNINVWSCGIGKNLMINLSLKEIFKPIGGPAPTVYCSPHFVIFYPDNNNQVQRLKASYWPYYFKRGYRPSISEMSYALSRKFSDTIDWAQALESESIEEGIFHQKYHIPVSHIWLYENKDDRPNWSNQKEKEAWIKAQQIIMDKVGETEIDFDKFNWQLNRIIHTNEKGDKVFAVKAIGMATVLNVLSVE
ncbi:MAG: hypothetical protein HKN09_07380 [Saprospiraceae bacterium]|nr:hypothetical protein [Saprospiraceae bacterium]